MLADFPACLSLIKHISGDEALEREEPPEDAQGFCGKQLAVARRAAECLFNILIPALSSPVACYFHWVGASAEFLPVVSNLERFSAIMFHPGISKMQRGKNLRRCLARGSVLR